MEFIPWLVGKASVRWETLTRSAIQTSIAKEISSIPHIRRQCLSDCSWEQQIIMVESKGLSSVIWNHRTGIFTFLMWQKYCVNRYSLHFSPLIRGIMLVQDPKSSLSPIQSKSSQAMSLISLTNETATYVLRHVVSLDIAMVFFCDRSSSQFDPMQWALDSREGLRYWHGQSSGAAAYQVNMNTDNHDLSTLYDVSHRLINSLSSIVQSKPTITCGRRHAWTVEFLEFSFKVKTFVNICNRIAYIYFSFEQLNGILV